MSPHVLLNLLKELGKQIRGEGFQNLLIKYNFSVI